MKTMHGVKVYLEKRHGDDVVEDRMPYGHHPSVHELHHFSLAVDGVLLVLRRVFHMISDHRAS